MNWFFYHIKNWIAKRQEKDETDLQDLKLAFKTRFYAFRLLLQANNSALENI